MKKLVTSMILGTMIISSASMSFANADSTRGVSSAINSQFDYEVSLDDIDLDGEECQMPSFKEYMKESKDYLKPVDKVNETKLKGIYESALKLEDAKEYDKAMKKWDDFYEIFDKFVDESKIENCTVDCEEFNIEEIKFDDYMKDLSEFIKPVSKEDTKLLKKFYNKAIEAEKASKYDVADTNWISFEEILDKYFEE